MCPPCAKIARREANEGAAPAGRLDLNATSGAQPVVGGLYRVDTVLLSVHDPKRRRPAVVIALPPYGLPDLPVLTRTSDTTVRGIPHPRNPGLGLSKDGVFGYAYLRRIDARHFTASPHAVVFLGMLEQEYFAKVLAWWEER